MAVSPIGFNELLLQYIWRTCLILLLLIFIMFLFLLIRKFYNSFDAKKKQQRHQQLTQILLNLTNGSELPINKVLLAFKYKDDDVIICDVAANLLRMVRGHSEKQLVDILQAWDILRYIKQVLRNGRRGKQIQALAILAHFRDPQSLELILENIANPDINIQLIALYALAERSAVDYLPIILPILIHSQQRNMHMLAWILKNFHEPAIPFLVTLAQSDATIEIRLAAIFALTHIGSSSCTSSLLQLANDPKAEIRAATITALTKIADMHASSVIIKALADPHHLVRIQAAYAVGTLKLNSAIPELITLLNDEDWGVRYRAAEALYNLKNRGRALLGSIAKQSDNAGDIAQQVLAEQRES